MRHVPKLRGSRLRRFTAAAALGATALAGAVAPAQAAGPPQQINKSVQLTCTLDLGGFVLRNLLLNVNVYAQVPSDVYLSDSVYIENSYAEIEIPPDTASALVYTGGDTVEGVADVFNLQITNTNPANVNVTDPPVPYDRTLVPPGQTTSMRVPSSGTLPNVGPITAAPTAQVGDIIVARLTALQTMLHITNSTDPSFEADLPFQCVNRTAGVDPDQNIVSEIPIVAEPEPDVIPDATSVAPASIEEGTASVTLSGTDLDAATSVTANGDAVDFTVNGDGTITVDTSALAPGTYSIVVAGEDGADATPVSLTVTAAPEPVIPDATSVAPASIEEGTASVTLSGTDLSVVDSVEANGDAVDFTVNANGTITVDTSDLAAGTYSIVVAGPDGADASPVSLTVTEPAPEPVIPDATSVAPASIEEGTASVTLSGTDLSVVDSVEANGDAVDFTVNGDGTITVDTSDLAAGTYSIVVAGPDGADASPVSLTVTEPAPEPVIPDATSASPSEFEQGTVSSVTLSGTDLGVVDSVTANGNPIAFTVNANGTITLDVAGAPAGTYSIVVSGPDGADGTPVTVTITEPAPEPVIPNATSVNPATIAAGTARTVTLSGTDLGVVDAVAISGNAATFTTNANGTLTVNVPALAAGTYSIVVSGPDGADASPVTLTVEQDTPPVGQKPTVSKLLPNVALAHIGGITLVTGTNLDTTKKVTVGGKAASFVKVSKTQLLVLLPGLKKGTYDLVVTNANGASATGAASKVKYLGLW